MRAAVDLAKRHRNINGVVVGNETIFRGEKSVDELIKLIQRVKREVQVPVTTGEIWHVWIEHPELASAVDFIAAHILPYWEGFSETPGGRPGDPDLRPAAPGLSGQAHRDRRVRLAERGLQSEERQSRPPASRPRSCATSSRRAEALGIDYNIVEATDQPWKIFEGSVGPYWGIFDSSRQHEVRLERARSPIRSIGRPPASRS